MSDAPAPAIGGAKKVNASSRMAGQIITEDDPDRYLTRHNYLTHSPLQLDYVTKTLEDPKYGGTKEVNLPRSGDQLGAQYLEHTLKGIIGVYDAADNTTYPALVPRGQCTAAPALNFDERNMNCLPAQEQLMASYEVDFFDSAAGLGGSLSQSPFAHWVYGAGLRVAEQITLRFGNQQVDEMDYDILNLWEELTGGPGDRNIDMHFKYEGRDSLILHSLYDHVCYVRLPWYYTMALSTALPLLSMQKHHIKYTIKFAALADLIVMSSPYIKVYTTVQDTATFDFTKHDGLVTTRTGDSKIDTQQRFPSHDRKSSGTLLAATDLSASLINQFLFVSDTQRAFLKQGGYQVLMHQWQRAVIDKSNGAPTVEYKMPFLHLVQGIYIVCRLTANEEANQWFNYSRIGPDPFSTGGTYGPLHAGTVETLEAAGLGNLTANAKRTHQVWLAQPDADPIATLKLRFNQQDRFVERPAKFWRVVTPDVHHTNVPRAESHSQYIYFMPMCAFPEDIDATGPMNFTKLDDATIVIGMHSSMSAQSYKIKLIARNHNFVGYRNDVGGVRYN